MRETAWGADVTKQNPRNDFSLSGLDLSHLDWRTLAHVCLWDRKQQDAFWTVIIILFFHLLIQHWRVSVCVEANSPFRFDLKPSGLWPAWPVQGSGLWRHQQSWLIHPSIHPLCCESRFLPSEHTHDLPPCRTNRVKRSRYAEHQLNHSYTEQTAHEIKMNSCQHVLSEDGQIKVLYLNTFWYDRLVKWKTGVVTWLDAHHSSF